MILNTAKLSTVTVGTPVLRNGVYFVKFKSLVIKSNNAGTGQLLNIVLSIGDSTIVDREEKAHTNNGNFVFFDRVSLEKTEKYDPNTRLKEIANAIGFTGDEIEESTILNQWVKVKVGYKAAEGEYRESNVIQSYLQIKASDNFSPPPF